MMFALNVVLNVFDIRVEIVYVWERIVDAVLDAKEGDKSLRNAIFSLERSKQT